MTRNYHDARVPSREHWCRECHSANVIPVWEDIEDFENENQPDWIGCMDCRKIRFFPKTQEETSDD